MVPSQPAVSFRSLLLQTLKQVLISVMAKNKRFQKEQLASEGYGEIVEIYENPLQ